MRRRDFILAMAALTAAGPRVVRGQQPERVRRVAYFSARSPRAEAPIRSAFLRGLEEAGFAAGRDVVVEFRFAEGEIEQLPLLLADLMAQEPDVLVATEPAAALVAKGVTARIPIVFTSGQDPVRLGLVTSVNRPGGNVTGVSLFTSELGPKRLSLLREILPAPGLIAFLADPKSLTTPDQIEAITAAATAIGQPILTLQAHDDDEIVAAFGEIAERRVAGVLYGTSTSYQVNASKLVALAARYRVPALYEWREFVVAGGLMSYSTSLSEVGRQLGDYVARILKGVSPATLPVVQSARFELVINQKTASALGLSVPPTLLARADEVIE